MASRNLIAQLLFLAIAATFGLFDFPVAIRAGTVLDLPALISLVAFLCAGVLVAVRRVTRPQSVQARAEAVANAIEEVIWRYVTAALPFAESEDPELAARSCEQRIQMLLDESHLNVSRLGTSPAAITAQMRALRAQSPTERQAVYLEGRLRPVANSFSEAAEQHAKRAERWRVVVLICNGVGVVCAGLRVVQLIHIDLLGFAAAVSGVFSSWSEAQHHDARAQSMGIVARRLQALTYLGEDVTLADSQRLSSFVDNVETLLEGFARDMLTRM